MTSSKTVKANDTVKVHYKGTLEDGQVFDESAGRDPLQFTIGEGQLIPGFENAVLGMAIDDVKTVTIPSGEAYGPVKDELMQEISKEYLPEDLDVEVGMQLVSKQENGAELVVNVSEIKDETIIIDANHPLAGKDLTFEIQLVEIL
jgi:FKBP-type peptidyl-prolyl cis-trans isomerase SlpA